MSSSSSELPTTSQNSKNLKVNNKIIQNYLQHAKGRDIKRFMRLNSKSASSEDSEYIIGMKLFGGQNDDVMRVASDSEAANEQPSSSRTKSATPRTPEKKVNDDYVQAPDSITKNTKKLEWDSLGDVGYNKSSSTGNLSSLERSVLKELLSESPSEPNISSRRSNELKTSSNLSLSKQMRQERWRQTLENLGKKYSSLSMNLPDFSDQPQSTPLMPANTQKAVQTAAIQTTFDQAESTKKGDRIVANADHACQTSFDRMTSRRFEKRKSQEDHAVQTTFRRSSSILSKDGSKKSLSKAEDTQTSLSSRMGSLGTQSSFEYYPGDNETSSSMRRSVRRNILGEHNRNSEINTPKTSPESDKENKPDRENKRGKSEVELGIKLLCSLIDAKNLTGKQKKNLAKKIFEKIMKEQPCTSSTTSQTSRSSIASVQSLIESTHPDETDSHASGTLVEEAPSTNVVKVSEETQTELVKVREHPASSSSSHEEPVTMREWLHPLTRSEKDYDEKLKKKALESPSAQSVERQKQLSWIEAEINRLEGLKHLLQEGSARSRATSSTSTIHSNRRPEVIYEETENVVNEQDGYQHTTRKSSQVVIYDEPHADVENVKYKTTKVTINQERRASSSSSVRNHRSKLETPTSSSSLENESVSAFASQLQKEFMDKYSKKKRPVSEHYSEPRVYGKPALTRNPSYTSVASSSFCVSSEMSIPIVESSSSSTTTHQYDSNTGNSCVEGVAVQTSYSIVKTQPIFGPRCKCICICGKQCRCSCPRPTLRVSGTTYHQTVQVKPQALAYVIRFTGKTDNEGKRLTKDCCTLQERLEAQYPDFCEKANRRQEILKKLHELRQERENRIREIAETSNTSSIVRKLDELPPPPIKQVRIFPPKEAKVMAKKRYNKLPEVVAKQEREKLERKKRANRIITGVFNKKLQKMVHNGKLSLEHSRTVI